MAITAGTPPNLVCQAGADEYIILALKSGTAVEVELPDEFKEDLIEGWYESMKFNGKIYAVPLFCAAGGMVVNTSAVEAVGAQDLLPKPPDYTWDFDQWLELMKAVTDESKPQYGFFVNTQLSSPFFYWPEQVLSWNWGTDTLKYQDGKWSCRLNEEAGVAWLQWMQDLYFKHHVIPNPSGSSENRWQLFQQGRVVTHVGPNLSLSRRSAAKVDPETLEITDEEFKFKWRYVQPPTNPSVPHALYWGGGLLDFNQQPFKTEKVELVKPTVEFALWVSNRDNQKFLAQYLLPVRKSAIADVKDPLLQWYMKNCVPYGRGRIEQKTGQSKAVVEQFQLLLQKLYLPTPPAQAVAEFCAAVDAINFEYFM
jgi:ABC-type glycerol-3-phosphate transport system substrate-binding protein